MSQFGSYPNPTMGKRIEVTDEIFAMVQKKLPNENIRTEWIYYMDFFYGKGIYYLNRFICEYDV